MESSAIVVGYLGADALPAEVAVLELLHRRSILIARKDQRNQSRAVGAAWEGDSRVCWACDRRGQHPFLQEHS
jgi:hypothetical protein